MIFLIKRRGKEGSSISFSIARSSNGRTPGFGPGYLGSNPSLAAKTLTKVSGEKGDEENVYD